MRDPVFVGHFAALGQDLVRTLNDMQVRPLPPDTVLARRVGVFMKPAGFVPHFVDMFVTVVKNCAVLRSGKGQDLVLFHRSFGIKYRIIRVFLGAVADCVERTFFNEEVVDEQLSAESNVDHLGR